MKSLFVFLCCAGMLGASAYHHGRFTDNTSERDRLLEEAAERLGRAPAAFGEWTSVERPVSDEDAMRRGGAVRYISRIYRRSGSADALSVLILCGHPGPLSVHTPEVCVAGAAFDGNTDQRRLKHAPDSEFIWQTFLTKIDGQPSQEMAWAWSTDGRWVCPTSPRVAFGREPFLFKVYVTRPVLRAGEPSAGMVQLLKDLIPALQRTVFEQGVMKSSDHSRPTSAPDSGKSP